MTERLGEEENEEQFGAGGGGGVEQQDRTEDRTDPAESNIFYFKRPLVMAWLSFICRIYHFSQIFLQ